MNLTIPLSDKATRLVESKKNAIFAKEYLGRAIESKESPFFTEAIKSINQAVEVINLQLESEVMKVIKGDDE